MRKSRLISFRDKMRKNLVYVLVLQFKGSCFFQLQIFTPTYIVFGLNVKWVNLPQWNGLFTQRQKLVCNSQRVYPRPPNILHLLCVWVKCVGGKITPLRWAVFIKLYPKSKAHMLLSKILPQTSTKFTQIYLPYLWHYATLHWSVNWLHLLSCYITTKHTSYRNSRGWWKTFKMKWEKVKYLVFRLYDFKPGV